VALSVEKFDPDEHGAEVREFVMSGRATTGGFRSSPLSDQDWQQLVHRVDMPGFKYIALLRYPDEGIASVVVPTIRSPLFFRDNAFLHIFGRPTPQTIASVVNDLQTSQLAAFCQTLVPADANAAIATLVRAGGRNVEHEVFMRFDTKAPTLRAFRRSQALIRSFVSADTQQLAQLHQIGFGFDISYTAKHFDLSESDDRLLLVAELGGAIVGYCEIDASAKNWWIDGLVTSEHVRRQGIATSLMISALEKVPTNASMYLNVSSRNPAAIELYNKFGFSEFQRQSRYVFLGCEPVAVVNVEAGKP
jgi:ribosomal protein S18 acetylase RimI-like enzyme